MNAVSFIHRTDPEDPEMRALREALGAVATAPALAYCLSRSGTRWRLRRLDRQGGDDFDSRGAAVAAMRRAVVRCSAYGLVVEGCDGTFDVQFSNWDDQSARKFGIRP